VEPVDPPDDESRAARLARRRNKGSRRRTYTIGAIVVVLVVGATATYAIAFRTDSSSAGTETAATVVSAAPTTRSTTTIATTTTSTIPPVKQPKNVTMPAPGGLRIGSRGGIVQLYEQRMKDLHFDPGPVDGVFDQDTSQAVITVQKYFNQPRTGVIDGEVQLVLSHFTYSPAEANTEANRVEIDLDRQVLTVFQNWQPILLTTTSTGSGEHFCGGSDGCQYAITPTGHFHFYSFVNGWDNGKLGKMWNPYYFNGGIAVHGLASVPPYPASHGCARIPIFIADYFHTLVTMGESVFVVGTPKQPGNAYVGPIKTPPPAPATTAPPATTPPTTAKSPPTTKTPPTTKPKH
jgi:peptidoglycan hydrolase-like protein with peptidoglycan-binding domain